MVVDLVVKCEREKGWKSGVFGVLLFEKYDNKKKLRIF
jgi:hypothetical protein